MKNFKDIKESNIISYIITTGGKLVPNVTDIQYNISNIKVLGKSLIFNGKSTLLGDGLYYNNGTLNSSVKLFCDSPQIIGDFSNLSIKKNSLIKEKISNLETNRIFSTSGNLVIGSGLTLNGDKIERLTNQISINTGLITVENPSNITQSGIYILNINTFVNITLDINLDRVYVINSSMVDVSLNSDIVIYSGEICLISLGEKIKTNNVGDYLLDNNALNTNNNNTEYHDGDLVITSVEKLGTTNNPIIYLYTIYKDLEIKISGPNGELLLRDTNYTYSYNELLERYEIVFISGSSSQYFGTYEPGGINLTGNNSTTSNGIYTIYVNEFLQKNKKVYELIIDTKKSIIIGDFTLVLKNPELVKTGNLLSDVLTVGNGITIQSCQINQQNYVLGNLYTFTNGSLIIESNGDYTLTLLKKSVSNLPEVLINCIDSNFVIDSGTRSFSMVELMPDIYGELKVSNSETFNINIFDYFNFYGENLQISSGVLGNSLINDFGTITFTSSGNLTINPIAFSTNTYTLNFEVSGQKNYSVPLKLYFNDANTTTHWKISLNGCFSEIKFKDSIDSNYKTLNNSNGVSSITRVNNESTGIEIQENGTFFDGNYYRGIDDLFLSIEDELLEPANNISDREYTTSSLRDGTNLPKSTYIIVFNSPIRITELLISPSVNNNTFMPLPNTLSLFKSLDNGNTWLKISDYSINEENIPIEWYPYIVGVENKLNALYQTGGFFRIII